MALSSTSAWRAPRSLQRRVSRRLFFYVLRDFLFVLGCCIAGFLILFLFASMFEDLEGLLRRDAPASAIINYFLLLQPANLVRVLPMSLMLATAYILGDLCRHNEMTAMQASGISLPQGALPLLLFALLLTPLHAWLAEWVAPQSTAAARDLQQALKAAADRDLPAPKAYLAFRNRADRRDWLFQGYSPGGVSTGVVVTQFRSDGTMDWELRARQASFTQNAWEFTDVLRVHFDDRGEFYASAPEVLPTLRALPLREDPRRLAFVAKTKVIETLSAPALWSLLTDPHGTLTASTLAALKTHLIFRLTFPLSCVLAVLLGLPMAITNERGAAMKGVIVAAGLMVAFHLSAEIFQVLGTSLLLPPLIAGAAPCLAFTLWGVYSLIRRF